MIHCDVKVRSDCGECDEEDCDLCEIGKNEKHACCTRGSSAHASWMVMSVIYPMILPTVAALPSHPQCGLNRETFPCVETRLR